MSSSAHHNINAIKEDSQESRVCEIPSRKESNAASIEHTATKRVHLLSGDAAPFIPSFLRNSNIHSEIKKIETLPQLATHEGDSSNSSLVVSSEWTVEGSEEIKSNFGNINNEEQEKVGAHTEGTIIPSINNYNNSCCAMGNKENTANVTSNSENNLKSVDSIAVTVTDNDYDDNVVVDAHGGINSYTNASSFLTEHNPYYAILHGMSGDEVQYLISMLPYEVQQAYDENVRILYNSSRKIEEEYKCQQQQQHQQLQQQQQHYNYEFNVTPTNNATELEQNVHGVTFPLANTVQDKASSITLSAAYKTFQELTQEQLEQINNFFSQAEISQSMTANILPAPTSTKNTDTRRRQSRRYRHNGVKINRINTDNNNNNNFINANIIASRLDIHTNDGNVLEDEMNSDE